MDWSVGASDQSGTQGAKPRLISLIHSDAWASAIRSLSEAIVTDG